MTLVLSSCDKHVLGFYYKGNILIPIIICMVKNRQMLINLEKEYFLSNRFLKGLISPALLVNNIIFVRLTLWKLKAIKYYMRIKKRFLG